MRRYAVLLGGLLGAAGCLAPFSWPEDRRPDEPAVAASADDALTRAADCLDRGDDAAAVPHLRAYLAAHPEAVLVRAHLAELLFREGRAADARTEFERFACDAEALTGPAHDRLVQCHTRLMEIAEADDDAYREHLHRGIGLVLLVNRWDADPDRRDETAAEQTMAKAAAALRTALEARPGDPRANLYLAEALARMGQTSAARSALRAARTGLPDPAVTPGERDRIALGL